MNSRTSNIQPTKHSNKQTQNTTVDMSASSTVFGTYELLEGVLSHLPSQDLRNAQQVNRDFKSVTDQSRGLQQNLFREAKPVERILAFKTLSWQGFGRAYITNPVKGEGPEGGDPRVITELHPLLTFDDEVDNRSPLFIDFPSVEKMLAWSGGSWEQELLMNPPCTKITIGYQAMIYQGESSDIDGDDVVLEDKNGIRWGAVIDSLRNTVQDINDTYELHGEWQMGNRGWFCREIMDHKITGRVYGFVEDRSTLAGQARKREFQEMNIVRVRQGLSQLSEPQELQDILPHSPMSSFDSPPDSPMSSDSRADSPLSTLDFSEEQEVASPKQAFFPPGAIIPPGVKIPFGAVVPFGGGIPTVDGVPIGVIETEDVGADGAH